jgi:hypothetical protein
MPGRMDIGTHVHVDSHARAVPQRSHVCVRARLRMNVKHFGTRDGGGKGGDGHIYSRHLTCSDAELAH